MEAPPRIGAGGARKSQVLAAGGLAAFAAWLLRLLLQLRRLRQRLGPWLRRRLLHLLRTLLLLRLRLHPRLLLGLLL